MWPKRSVFRETPSMRRCRSCAGGSWMPAWPAISKNDPTDRVARAYLISKALNEEPMHNHIYKYTFEPAVDLDELEGTLVLSIMGVESLHGSASVRLDASHYLDRQRRSCVIDASFP